MHLRIGRAVAIRALALREHACTEARRALEDAPHPRDLHDVHPQPHLPLGGRKRFGTRVLCTALLRVLAGPQVLHPLPLNGSPLRPASRCSAFGGPADRRMPGTTLHSQANPLSSPCPIRRNPRHRKHPPNECRTSRTRRQPSVSRDRQRPDTCEQLRTRTLKRVTLPSPISPGCAADPRRSRGRCAMARANSCSGTLAVMALNAVAHLWGCR